jgi:superfamily I DNA and/or RNA helicase
MAPLRCLVIDEAAQLKECESTIPLQLFGLHHAILIGDERQLPAIVNSEVWIFLNGSIPLSFDAIKTFYFFIP